MRDDGYITNEQALEALHRPGLAPGCEDAIMVHTRVKLSLWSRLRALFMPLTIATRIDCEKTPGRTQSVVAVHVLRPTLPWVKCGEGAINYDVEPENGITLLPQPNERES